MGGFSSIIQDSIIAGDTWAGNEHTLTVAGLNFAGATAMVEFYSVKQNTKRLEIEADYQERAVGTMRFIVALTAEQTALLAGDVVGYVRIVAGTWKATPIRIDLKVNTTP